MRIYAPKQKPTQETKAASSPRSSMVFSRQGCELSIIPDL